MNLMIFIFHLKYNTENNIHSITQGRKLSSLINGRKFLAELDENAFLHLNESLHNWLICQYVVAEEVAMNRYAHRQGCIQIQNS